MKLKYKFNPCNGPDLLMTINETESTKRVAIICCNDHSELDKATETALLFAASPELLKAIQDALAIIDLWLPNDDNHNEEHEGEFQALIKMRDSFTDAVKLCHQ